MHKTLVIAISLAVGAIACNNSDDPNPTADAGINTGKDAGHDLTYPKPQAFVYIVSPQHLSTNVDSKPTITFSVTLTLLDHKLALGYLKQSVTVTSLKDGTSVAGNLIEYFNNKKAEFIPSAPLLTEDYVVEVKETQYVKVMKGQARSVFHVGSLPRVTLVGFLESKTKSGSIDMIHVQFSENVSQAAVAAATKLTDSKSSSIGIKSSTGVGETTSINVQLLSPQDNNESVELEIGTDVGSSVNKLDGLYTGVAGSGPFKKSFKPGDFIGPNAWIPSI